MPFVKPKIKPGIFKTDTALQNEGAWIDGNRVRFYQGFPQPIGGWTKDSVTTFSGTARGAHAWSNLSGQICKAWGTESQLYGEVAGTRFTITPKLHFTVLNNAFSTVNGSPTVTVNLPFHQLSVGDPMVFSNHQVTVGGLTIEGTFNVASVISENQLTITAGSNASSTVTNGGGAVDLSVALPAGISSNTGASVGSGGSSPDTSAMRVWSLDSFGENLMANPSGYGLYEWQPESVYAELAFNGDFASSAGWGLGTEWSIGSGVASFSTATSTNLSQNIEGLQLDGRTCIITFTVNITGASTNFAFKINAGSPSPSVITVGAASTNITKSGTYTRVFRMPADAADIVFEASGGTAIGTLDNVSLKVYDKAYKIETAPARMDAMFVDPRGVVVAVGCTQTDGLYSPTNVRNCEVGNNRIWIPDTDNVASELTLRGGGGRLMAGCATRQQSLVWGDDGLFSLQWQGDAGAAFTPQLLATSCGLLSRHSFAKANGFVIFAANTREFYIFEGVGIASLGAPKKIPCPVRDDVFNNLDRLQSLKAHGGLNPEWTEFWFFWPDSRDFTNPTPSECSRYVAFNWVDNTWSSGMLNRTAWLPSGVLSSPVAFAPASAGAAYAYQHETGKTADGSALGAWLQSGDFDVEDGDRLSTIKAVAPDIKDQSGDITVTFKAKPFSNATAITHGPFTLGPTTQRVPTRILGRQVNMRYDWTTSGGFGRLGAMRFDINGVAAKR